MTYEEFFALDSAHTGKEGSVTNAKYWYERVGEPMPQQSLEEEWTALVRRFLQ